MIVVCTPIIKSEAIRSIFKIRTMVDYAMENQIPKSETKIKEK